MQLSYAYVTIPPGGDEGPAGTETGHTASTTAANAGIACGNPTQTDGRACSYAREDYSTAGPPHLRTTLNLTGSGAGKCTLFKFKPSTAAGSTSYVWGRRTPGSGGVGAVRESAVRYYGTNEFGSLCSVVGSGPAGWPGYLVKYDAGTTPSQVSAEAGLGASAPSSTAAGTISYWNGTGVSTMTPPAAGGAIPVFTDGFGKSVNYASGGYRIEISNVSLAAAPSEIFQICGAPCPGGAADRSEARAVLGSPVTGGFDYRVTNTSTGEVVADLHVAVDLGTMTAQARYAP